MKNGLRLGVWGMAKSYSCACDLIFLVCLRITPLLSAIRSTAYQQWPWHMRSTVDGRVAALSGGVLTLYAGAAPHAALWSVSGLDTSGPATLLWADDESTLVYSNATRLVSLSAGDGTLLVDVDLTAAPISASSCVAQQSPWSIPSPAILGNDLVVLVCKSSVSSSSYFVASVRAGTGQPSATTVPLSVTPDQVVVDAVGNLYAVGTTAAGALAVQRVAAP